MFAKKLQTIALFAVLSLAGSALWAQQSNEPDNRLTLAQQNQMPEPGEERSALLEEMIEVEISGATIEQALTDIAEELDLKLMYSKKILPVDRRVTLTKRPVTLYDALWEILDDTGLQFAISPNRQLVVMKMNDSEQADEVPVFQHTVNGTVFSSGIGEALPGVNIVVKGTTTSTTTDLNGEYSLTVPSENDTLVYSYIGYQAVEEPINGRSEIHVELAPSIISGNEIVVVGYGQQRRSTLTGAISTVPAEELNVSAVPNVEQALQGRVAGVEVRNNGGPGEAPIVQIRGISSINYGSDPLYVVDGLPSDISSINSRDIASIEVLKDASAAAIYGSRATNGVVLITTNKGARNSDLSVTYDSYAGMESPWKTIDLLNTQQYLEYERALNGAAGINPPPRLEPQNFNQPIYEGASQTYAETNTDWQDVYFRNGFITNQQLSLGGGNEISRFFLSSGYFEQEGITVGLHHQRGNFRLNSDHRLSDVFTVGENFSLVYSRQRFDNTQGNRTRLINVIRSLPYLPVRDPSTLGGFRTAENSFDGADPTNPVQDAVQPEFFNNTTGLRGTVYADLDIAPWLNFRSTFGLNRSNSFLDGFQPIHNSVGTNNPIATITNQRNVNTVLLFTQQLTFDQRFDKHHLNAVAVYEFENRDNFFENSSGNQSTNNVKTLSGATNVSHQTTRSETRLLSFIGRVNYEYDDKYLLNVAFRRDGLSIWAPGHKWANFPSASVGWRIDREAFMEDQNLISQLKLRGGYGITGLNGLLIGNNYPWQVPIQANAATYPFNNENDVGNASYIRALGNTNLEWEKTTQWNVGLDVALLSNRVTFTADYYQRNTDNLLLQVPIPTSFGLNDIDGGVGVLANVGEMENSGFDLQLGYNNFGDEFSWDVTGLVSIVRNEVLSLETASATIGAGGDQDFGGGEAITRTEAGHPIQSFYGYIVEGIFQDQQEINSSPTQSNAAPGDLKFRDINGDGVIDSNDRTYIGSYLPDFSYSLNFNANYRNFDLSLFLQGVQGNDIFNAAGVIREGMARLFGAGTAVLNAWTPDNRDTDIPRAVSGDPNGNVRPSTRWIEDGSYLRLKNVQLGYNVPPSALASFAGGTINNLRVYVAAQNLFTITGYSGWDPEIGSKNTTLTNGIDYGQYPVARSLMVGLQVEL